MPVNFRRSSNGLSKVIDRLRVLARPLFELRQLQQSFAFVTKSGSLVGDFQDAFQQFFRFRGPAESGQGLRLSGIRHHRLPEFWNSLRYRQRLIEHGNCLLVPLKLNQTNADQSEISNLGPYVIQLRGL